MRAFRHVLWFAVPCGLAISIALLAVEHSRTLDPAHGCSYYDFQRSTSPDHDHLAVLRQERCSNGWFLTHDKTVVYVSSLSRRSPIAAAVFKGDGYGVTEYWSAPHTLDIYPRPGERPVTISDDLGKQGIELRTVYRRLIE